MRRAVVRKIRREVRRAADKGYEALWDALLHAPLRKRIVLAWRLVRGAADE